ncbi:MAG: rpsB 1 [Proteobacteria bacterium]|nr:rpsB 1 [Pseudomonadota bacterium]
MTVMIIQAFFLTALAVGIGVLVGVLVKQWFGRRTIGRERLTEVMAAAEAAEAEAIDGAGLAERPATPSVEVVTSVMDAAVGPEVPSAEPAVPEPLIGPAAEVSAGLDRIAAADRVGERPPALPVARTGGADDLRRIRGIGPQNATRLNALGIYHFDQIATWTPAEMRWVGAYLAFPGRIEREDWIGQATVLAAGDRTEAAG